MVPNFLPEQLLEATLVLNTRKQFSPSSIGPHMYGGRESGTHEVGDLRGWLSSAPSFGLSSAVEAHLLGLFIYIGRPHQWSLVWTRARRDLDIALGSWRTWRKAGCILLGSNSGSSGKLMAISRVYCILHGEMIFF